MLPTPPQRLEERSTVPTVVVTPLKQPISGDDIVDGKNEVQLKHAISVTSIKP